MTERAMQYGKVLFELHIDASVIATTKELIKKCPELVAALDNPAIKAGEKYKVIDRIFDDGISSFLKVVTDNKMINSIEDIWESYEDYQRIEKNFVKATFYYVSKPDDAQIKAIKARICKQYQKDGVDLFLVEQPSLIGGFVLKVCDYEVDRSISGRIEQLTQNLMRR